MYIKYPQFDAYLKKLGHRVDNFYCVTGDELLLRNETIDLIRQHCRQLGFSERVNLVLEANDAWHAIQENLQHTSLFTEQKIVEITLPNGKTGRAGGPALIQLAEQMGNNNILDVTVIINLPKLDKRTKEAKWFKAIEKTAVMVDIPTIHRAQLPAWITQRLAQQDQSIDAQALDALVEKVEGNLFAAHQEILKLGLLHEKGQISLQSIEQAVNDVARFDVFQLTDAMLLGDAKRSIRILQGLHDEGEPLPLVLAMVTREIKTLYTLFSTQLRGGNIEKSMSQLRIFSQRQTTMRKALQRLNINKIMGIIQHLSDIDRLFKGYPVEGRLLDAWQELKRVVVKTAGNGIL